MLAKLKGYFRRTPLSKYTEEEYTELFKTREHYCTHPMGLPIFLKSVRWERPVLVNEVYKVLENWADMDPEDALQLLDAKYPDERVRKYAVSRIALFSDDELVLYMIQFAQCLLYEEFHFSDLAEMLIQRSLHNPFVVGHAFYWMLKSGLYMKASYERYFVILETFLLLCGKFVNEFWV